MSLEKLNIYQLRNIQNLHLTCSDRFNYICGLNGSGKTSILEAIYILFNGYSFRTREIMPLINYGQERFVVSGTSSELGLVSIQKSINGSSFAKLNNKQCNAASELAKLIPCQVFHQDIFQIIESSAQVRRGLLDWGLFHVEQSFHGLWKNYMQVLKQRNALLKVSKNINDFKHWNNKLVEYSDEINECRKHYFTIWQESFNVVLKELTNLHCEIDYYQGWDNLNLADVLQNEFHADTVRQYTKYGSHAADIIISVPHCKAKRVLSRGQQKIILIALKIAQAKLLDKNCIFLFDDLPAELDSGHIMKLLKYLHNMPGQFFITSIEPFVIQELDMEWNTLEAGMVVSRETIVD